MKKKMIGYAAASILLLLLMAGCGRTNQDIPIYSGSSKSGESSKSSENIGSSESSEQNSNKAEEIATPLSSQITELATGFSAVEFAGDDGFEAFLSAGGASSDAEVVEFLSTHLLADFDILGGLFGCSTVAAKNPEGEHLFGRNFDWQNCEALVVSSKPETGYASISTVNMDFISQSGGAIGAILKLNDVRTMAALYAPLDGMNEAGLAVSVNMIEDSATISQATDKPDITTTTAIRLLLNKVATVEDALELLAQYDMHASMGMMIHFALADKTGRSVVVEYIDNEMVVTETPVVTNFYLAQGEKNGIGSEQSKQRYNILMQELADNEAMTMQGVRDALDSVSKDNFDEFASTEWSIVFNLDSGVAHYYHREDYEKQYTFKVK